MNTSDPVAITPIEHGVIVKPEAITELIIKKKTHLYRLRRQHKRQAPPTPGNGNGKGKRNRNGNPESDFSLEHRFESMASWNWVASYVDAPTALAGLCSTFGFSFGTIQDGSMIEAESFIGPSGNISSHNGEFWFEPTENTAIFVTRPEHLPIGFARKGTANDHYELALHKETGAISIGYRSSFDDPWEMVDRVEGSIQDGVTALCQIAGLETASPPTHTEIQSTWEELETDSDTREFQ